MSRNEPLPPNVPTEEEPVSRRRHRGRASREFPDHLPRRRVELDVAESQKLCACWSHARRKFYDAKSSNPREAHQVLAWFNQLFDIEDQARPMWIELLRRLSVALPKLQRIDLQRLSHDLFRL